MGGRVKVKKPAAAAKIVALSEVLVGVAEEVGSHNEALAALVMATINYGWAHECIAPCNLAMMMVQALANIEEVTAEEFLTHLLVHTENLRQRSN